MAFDTPLIFIWIGCFYKLMWQMYSMSQNVMFQKSHVGGDIACPLTSFLLCDSSIPIILIPINDTHILVPLSLVSITFEYLVPQPIILLISKTSLPISLKCIGVT